MFLVFFKIFLLTEIKFQHVTGISGTDFSIFDNTLFHLVIFFVRFVRLCTCYLMSSSNTGYTAFEVGKARNSLLSFAMLAVFFLSLSCRDKPLERVGLHRLSRGLFFLDHTHQHTTVGRSPLDECSACHRQLYLTAHNTHN